MTTKTIEILGNRFTFINGADKECENVKNIHFDDNEGCYFATWDAVERGWPVKKMQKIGTTTECLRVYRRKLEMAGKPVTVVMGKRTAEKMKAA